MRHRSQTLDIPGSWRLDGGATYLPLLNAWRENLADTTPRAVMTTEPSNYPTLKDGGGATEGQSGLIGRVRRHSCKVSEFAAGLHREGLPAGFSTAWSDLTAGLCLGREAARLWASRMQQVAFRDLTASCRQVRKTPDVSKNCVTGTDKRIFKTRPGIVGVFTMQSRKCLNSLTQSFCFQSEWESPWIKADMVHGNKP